jgi:hypothetical protein
MSGAMVMRRKTKNLKRQDAKTPSPESDPENKNSRRPGESRDPGAGDVRLPWIPAFAGMTNLVLN